MIKLSIESVSSELAESVVRDVVSHASPLAKQALADAVISQIIKKGGVQEIAAEVMRELIESSVKEACKEFMQDVKWFVKNQLQATLDSEMEKVPKMISGKIEARIDSFVGHAWQRYSESMLSTHFSAFDPIIDKIIAQQVETLAPSVFAFAAQLADSRKNMIATGVRNVFDQRLVDIEAALKKLVTE